MPALLAWVDADPQDRHATRRDRLRRDPGRAGYSVELSGRRRRRGREVSRRESVDTVAAPTRRFRSSRSIRSGRWTWTRRSTWPVTGTATWCSTRSPTSPRSSRPAGSWPPKPGGAAPPCTARTPTPRCTRSSCRRVRPACCRESQRPAVLWTIRLDASGEPVEVDVRRTAITSVAQLNYPAVQLDADAGSLHPSIELLPGDRQVAAASGPGSATRSAWTSRIRRSSADRTGIGPWSCGPMLHVEQYNAEISLLTGMCAATIMLERRHRAAPDPAVADRRAGRRAAQNHCGAGHSVAGVDAGR